MPWEETRTQRHLTIDFLSKRRITAPAVWLRPESQASTPEDALTEPGKLQTDLNDWNSEEDERNLGLRLIDGYVELKIKSPDDVFFKLLAPQLDARAAYGPRDRFVTSVILQIANPVTIDLWANKWPRGHKDKAGNWVTTEIVYSATPLKSKPIWRNSAPLPGSRFAGNPIVWRPKGKSYNDNEEFGLEDLEARPLATTSMESICRAVAFATLGYWVRDYLDGCDDWDESLTRTLGGWIARQVDEGAAINKEGKSLESICWCSIHSEDTARLLIAYLHTLGATRDLDVAYEHGRSALERNAPCPGWPSIETLFGPQARVGIRRAFRAGIDIDIVEQMADLYVYDRTNDDYLDLDELLKGLRFEHKHDAMVARHRPDKFRIGKKDHNPFDIYAGSELRNDVQHREFRPGYQPGAILRYSPVHGLLTGDNRHPDEYRLLNTFPGFTVKPIATIDQVLMVAAISMLDRMLGLLTRDNDDQILWLKKFIAWIAQHPEVKPQVCPIIVGGQGIGKSLFGDNLMKALFGVMAGTADAASLTDNKFLITPFIGRLITFIDEVRLESVSAINIIKRLVRSDNVSGQVKFGHQRDYYIPSRLMIASNSPDIGLTPADAADRAFFFIISWTAENRRMTDREFLDWSVSLKPFYASFVERLENIVFRQHLMRYFMDLPVERAELEDLKHSSRDDENVIRATMSKAREIARAIVADARVASGNDITARFTTLYLREAIKRHDGPRTKVEAADVMMEFRRAGVLETVRGDLHYFKYRYATLLKHMGDAHSLPITNHWDYEPDDYGENDETYSLRDKQWRGNRQKGGQQQRQSSPDPDYMPDY